MREAAGPVGGALSAAGARGGERMGVELISVAAGLGAGCIVNWTGCCGEGCGGACLGVSLGGGGAEVCTGVGALMEGGRGGDLGAGD